jgi:hypothetical protein
MKTKITRINYGRLRNHEFILVVIYTINLCGKYDNKKLYLDKSYEELLEFRPVLESIKVYVHKNEKLNLLGVLDIERDTLITCTNNTVKSFRDIDLPDISIHYEVLAKLLSSHQTKTIASDSRTSETERLLKFEEEVMASPAIQAAFQAFNLQPIINRLFAINRQYDALFQEYIEEKGTDKRIDMVDLRKRCTKALGQYFDAVQYCAFAHEENDYQQLIDKLEQLSVYYNQQIKKRAARRKSDKKADDATIEPPTDDGNYTSF